MQSHTCPPSSLGSLLSSFVACLPSQRQLEELPSGSGDLRGAAPSGREAYSLCCQCYKRCPRVLERLEFFLENDDYTNTLLEKPCAADVIFEAVRSQRIDKVDVARPRLRR